MARVRTSYAAVALGLIVVTSFAVRSLAAIPRSAPRFFPDEYIYTAIARSLADTGRALVRGDGANFPALLEPIAAAPLQALFSPVTAYRLTQVENALFMSLAAIPVYLLARRLALSQRYALMCALFAVAIPDLNFASYTLADPVAYPLALSAVAAGVVAVERPTRRAQIVFLAFAFLATFARVQYVVLLAAFVVAAVAVDRRRILRTQRLPLIALGILGTAALASGPARLLGYYSAVIDLHVGGQLVRWFAIDVFLLTLVAGVVLIPGAVVGLVRARGRTDVAFATFAAALAGGLLFEAALYASNAENGTGRFQERYLFSLLPLVPIAFGLYLKRGRPSPRLVAAASVAILVAAARAPRSAYTAANGKAASPFLFGVFDLERQIGVAEASLAVAVVASVAAGGAVAVARWGGGRAAVGVTIAAVALMSFGAYHVDRPLAAFFRETIVAPTPSWVDATGLGAVTLVQTHNSPPVPAAIEQLYWNRSIVRQVRLGDALPTDVYAAPAVRIARDGTAANIHGPLLVHSFGTTARFANATAVATFDPFTLYTFDGKPRVVALAEGRYEDGWLSNAGRFRIWPSARRGTVRFSLSLPRDSDPVTLAFGSKRYRVTPGRPRSVSTDVAGRKPWDARFESTGGSFRDGRIVSVRSTMPVFTRS